MKSRQKPTFTYPTAEQREVELLAATISTQFSDPKTFSKAALSLVEGESTNTVDPVQAKRLFENLHKTAVTFGRHNASVGFARYLRMDETAEDGEKDLARHQAAYEGVLNVIAGAFKPETMAKADFITNFRRHISSLGQ